MSKKDNNKDTITEEAVKETSAETVDNKESKKKKKTDPVEELTAQLELEKDRYLRLFAEFENYKKRTGRERIEFFKTASQEVMISLLPVLDDFDRALKEIEKTEDDSLSKGVELISNKFRETLRVKGLKPVETQQGDVFDAEIHEAVTQIPAPDDSLKGKIIDVIEKGYTLGDRIIRYPKVVIGQ
jgi:molecular chaperone GrpE